MERTVASIFLAVRAVHVAQGAICFLTGRRAYRRQWLAAAAVATAAADLAWLARRDWTNGAHDATSARVDAAAGMLGLIGLAAATTPEDRTTTMNWMLPTTVGTLLGVAFALPRREGMSLSAAFAGAYAASVSTAIVDGGGPASTALANTISYPAFFAVGDVLVGWARRMASELDEARRREVEHGAEIAAASARNRANRLLHDSALQALESLARATDLAPERMRAIARAEADTLRRAMTDGPSTARDLLVRLRALVNEFTERGLRVELVTSELTTGPGDLASVALADAAREALTNVLKHANVDRAVLRAATVDGGTRVTIRDHGKGFDPTQGGEGFGLRQSMRGRMAEAGGSALVTSTPGRGTRVELWIQS